MKLKTVFLTIVALASTLSYAQEVPWSDSHHIINVDLAVKMNIDDPDILIRMAVNDFDKMFKIGLLDKELCKLFQINDHVDFCDYLYGFWDTTYAQYKPGSDQARREIEADGASERAWENAQSAIKLDIELSSNPKYDRTSGAAMIREYLQELTSWQNVHDSFFHGSIDSHL
jgi:hypothetical protein